MKEQIGTHKLNRELILMKLSSWKKASKITLAYLLKNPITCKIISE